MEAETKKETRRTCAIPAFFECKITESSCDYPKVSIVSEFIVSRDGVRDRIKSIDKDAIERLLAQLIVDFTVLVPYTAAPSTTD